MIDTSEAVLKLVNSVGRSNELSACFLEMGKLFRDLVRDQRNEGRDLGISAHFSTDNPLITIVCHGQTVQGHYHYLMQESHGVAEFCRSATDTARQTCLLKATFDVTGKITHLQEYDQAQEKLVDVDLRAYGSLHINEYSGAFFILVNCALKALPGT